ncbi:MAG: hypothetical protein ACE5R6_18560 [Candidatus Heimdallarchaeota archaeon]
MKTNLDSESSVLVQSKAHVGISVSAERSPGFNDSSALPQLEQTSASDNFLKERKRFLFILEKKIIFFLRLMP